MFEGVLSELKRRNVIRVAAVYTVTAWGLFQIAKTVFETLAVPRWASVLTLVLLTLGLPISLIIAWAFERGPDGRVSRTAKEGEDAPKARLSWVEGGLLAGVVVVLAISALQIAGVFRGAGADSARPTAGASVQSVAVLPFASFSANTDAGYFADGLTEEVINSLAQIPDLKVAGRTSAFYFKGKNEDLREVGKRLGVTHVIEGSVRREGDRLRVTAQLISVADGFHLWSNTYDRQMDDAFAIQTEIANAVAEALKIKLMSPMAGPAKAGDIYDQEVRAKAYVRNWGLEPLKTARALYQGLMRADPKNPDNYAGFALATTLLMQNYMAVDFVQGSQQANAAIDQGLKVDPNAASLYVAKGWLSYVTALRGGEERFNRDADAAYRKALALEPRNPDALIFYGVFLSERARIPEATAYLQRALEIDPLNRVGQLALGRVLSRAGRSAEAQAQYRAIIDLHPDFIDAKLNLGMLLLEAGKLDQAEPWLKAAAAPGDDPTAVLPLVILYANLGLKDDMFKAADGLATTPSGAEIRKALPLVYAGQHKAVVAFADSQLAHNDDPFWRSVAASAAFMGGDYARARREVEYTSPGLFLPEPRVTLDRLSEALGASVIVGAQGDPAQEKRILRGVLAAAAPRPGMADTNTTRIARVRAYAELGDKPKALAELRAAIDAGYRTLWDIDLARLERYPNLAGLRNDPQFRAMVAEVEADLKKQREAVLASRK